ncbi:ABC transporter permease [Cryobacterium sp. Hh7]|uniref:ABC transporter permease n=1 Tax=Cryobacterium sp. Hh7 TaxID=1259159 RepID=UPI001069046E|nr:ABC transporter permease [Cryobacterium sp. Hh7]TFD52678.1 ABC transporter permease [Cryobacterium sp. Hh7]
MTPSSTPVASATAPNLDDEFKTRPTNVQRTRNVLHRYPVISPALVLICAVIIFGLINDRFYTPQNLSLIAQQVAVVGSLAVGQTLIILTAGIDLSVGAVMVMSALVTGQTAVNHGVNPVVALISGFLVGMGAGLLNGIFVTRLKLPPFIVTLGTLNIFLALSLLYSGGSAVRGSDMPALLTWTGVGLSLGPFRITTGVILMILIYVVIGYALAKTAWGRHVYAVGDDLDAARLSGISVNRVLLSVYVVAGFVMALAAWIQIGRTNAASPNVAGDLNLDSITAVVIGGTSLFGGRGMIWGTLLGALIVGVFRNGLSLAGFDALYQTLAVGVLIIVAVALDQWIRKGRK